MNIVKDNLPSADCIILRQVLQHLSNAEVQQIITKLSAYKYIILTEHLPNGNFNPIEILFLDKELESKNKAESTY